MSSYNPLRAVANRLTSCPIEQLPHQIGFLSTALANCSDAFTTAKGSDNSITVHKIRTKTSALLQDRSPEGRFCGIVLARALIEAGGVELLSESGNLVRSLITCLNKPDAWEVKRVCILTITRIYLLSKDHQALVREITTPTLPAFTTASLNAIKPTTAVLEGSTITHLSPLLPVVLRSWIALIEHFAPTFRPSTPVMKSVCLSLLTDTSCSDETRDAAITLLGRLHFCAAKNGGAAELSLACSQAIEAAHDTADLVFRAVIEDWTPTVTRTSKATRKQRMAGIPATSSNDVLGLEKWQGITEGCKRLQAYLSIISELFTTKHSQEMNIPFGLLLDLTARLAAVTPPTKKFSLRTNNEISRDEHEELWLNIHDVHCRVLRLFTESISTYKQALHPLLPSMLQQASDIFESGIDIPALRVEMYQLFGALLRSTQIQFEKSDSSNLKTLINACCEDIRYPDRSSNNHSMSNGNVNNHSGKTTGSIRLDPPTKKGSLHVAAARHDLDQSAWTLLPILLEHLPFHVLSGGTTIRAQIDGQAILLQHHEALLSSVLFPLQASTKTKTALSSTSNPSLLPFLSQAVGASESPKTSSIFSAEALLRPRMPLLRTVREIAREGSGIDDEDSESDDEAADQNPIATIADTEMSTNEDTHDPLATEISSIKKNSTSVNVDTERDFTAVVEANADAQLAASTPSETQTRLKRRDSINGQDVESSKRQRIDGLEFHTQPTQRDTEIVQPADTQDTGPMYPAAASTISTASTEFEKITPLLSTTSKQPTQNFEDSDSNSDIPPIDATLAMLTDSEDENDDS